MKIPEGWIPKEQNTVSKILEEAKDSDLFRTPIPIKNIIESYLGDVHCVTRMDNELFPTGVSAFSTKDMNLGWIIVVNGQECIERQRFSIAHELAHIVLFVNQSKTVYCSHDNESWDEKLCDRFAGDILMPNSLVREAHKSMETPYIEDIAKIFKVSSKVAEIQLKRLGLPFVSKLAQI